MSYSYGVSHAMLYAMTLYEYVRVLCAFLPQTRYEYLCDSEYS